MSDNLKKLHSSLSEKWDGFSISYEQFEKDMQDEEKLKKLHSNLSSKWEGFSVPYEQFKNDVVVKKKELSGQDSETPGKPSGWNGKVSNPSTTNNDDNQEKVNSQLVEIKKRIEDNYPSLSELNPEAAVEALRNEVLSSTQNDYVADEAVKYFNLLQDDYDVIASEQETPGEVTSEFDSALSKIKDINTYNINKNIDGLTAPTKERAKMEMEAAESQVVRDKVYRDYSNYIKKKDPNKYSNYTEGRFEDGKGGAEFYLDAIKHQKKIIDAKKRAGEISDEEYDVAIGDLGNENKKHLVYFPEYNAEVKKNARRAKQLDKNYEEALTKINSEDPAEAAKARSVVGYYQVVAPAASAFTKFGVDFISSIGRLNAATKTNDEKRAINNFVDDMNDYFDVDKSTSIYKMPSQLKGGLYEEGDFQAGKIIPKLSETLAQMYTLVLSGGGIAKGLKGAKYAANTGLFTSSLLSTQNQYYQDAKDEGMSDNEALSYSLTSAVTTSLLEMVSPQKYITGNVAKGKASKDAVKEIMKGGSKTKAILKNFFFTGKEGVKEVAQEFSQEGGNLLNNYVFNKLTDSELQTTMGADEMKELATLTFLAGGIGSTSGFKNADQGRMESFVEAMNNQPAIDERIKVELEKGNITKDQAEEVKSKVNSFKKTFQAIPEEYNTQDRAKLAMYDADIKELESKRSDKEALSIEGVADQEVESINNEIEKIKEKAQEITSKDKMQQAVDAPKAIIESHMKEGGSSISQDGTNLAGKPGFAVSAFPERSLVIEGQNITEEDINEFKEDNKDLLKDPNNFIGTWYDKDSDVTYIDVSNRQETIEEATKIAKKYNQKAIFNLENFEEIDTGGTGEAVTKAKEIIVEQPDDRVKVTRITNTKEVYPNWENGKEIINVYPEDKNGEFDSEPSFSIAIDEDGNIDINDIDGGDDVTYVPKNINEAIEFIEESLEDSGRIESIEAIESIKEAVRNALPKGVYTESKTSNKPKNIKKQNVGDIDAIVEAAPDTESKKALGTVKNVITAITGIDPDVEFIIHEDSDSYSKAIQEEGGEADTESSGFFDTGSKIHINVPQAQSTTAFHEGGHKVIDAYVKRNPEVKAKWESQLRKALPKEAVAELDEFTEGNEFSEGYEQHEKQDEFITEALARIADGQIKLDKSALDKVKDFIRSVAKAVGLDPSSIKLESNEDIKDFARKVSEAFIEGKEIKILEDLKNEVSIEPTIITSLSTSIPEKTKSYKKSPKLQKNIKESDIIDINTLKGKPVEFMFYDNFTSDNYTYNNEKIGYSLEKKGEGGAGYSFREPMLEIGAVGAVTNIQTGMKILNHIKTREGISKDKPITAVALQSKDYGHLGNVDILNDLYGDDGHLVNMIKNGVPEKEIVRELKKAIDYYNGLSWGKSLIQNKIDIKSSDIKSVSDLFNILKTQGFGNRNIFNKRILQEKPTKITKATPGHQAILHNKYGMPTLQEISNIVNEEYTSEASSGDVVKFIDIDYTRLGVTDPSMINRDEIKRAKDKGVKLELIPSEYAHKSYPVVFFGKNIGIPSNFVSLGDINPSFEKYAFYKAGRRGAKSPEIRMPEITPKNETSTEEIKNAGLEGMTTDPVEKKIKKQKKAKKGDDLMKDFGKTGRFEMSKRMTEDGEGNYLFFHYSGTDFKGKKIDPKYFGKNPITQDKRMHKVSFYYTQPGDREGMVGQQGVDVKVVAVPKDKVYPLQTDPLNFYDEAEKRFREDFDSETLSFDPWWEASYIGQVAKDNGYEMLVSIWGGLGKKALRGESQNKQSFTKGMPKLQKKIPVIKEREAKKTISYLSKKYGIEASLEDMGMFGSYGRFNRDNLDIKINRETTLNSNGELSASIKPTGYISRRTIFHEFIHPFVEVLEKKNPKLYNEIYNKANSENRKNQFADVSHYSEINRKEEMVVRYLDRISDNDIPPSLLQRFLDWINNTIYSNRIRKSTPLQELDVNTSVEELYDVFKNYGLIKEDIKDVILQDKVDREIKFIDKILENPEIPEDLKDNYRKQRESIFEFGVSGIVPSIKKQKRKPRGKAVQRAIDKETGVKKPVKWVKMTERTALKNKIKDLARGYREGTKLSRDELQTAKKELVEHINSEISDYNISKAEQRVIRNMVRDARRSNMDKLMDKLDRLIDRAQEREARAMRKEIRRVASNPKTLLRKVGKTWKAKVPANVREYISNIDVAALDNMSREDLREMYKTIKEVLAGGRADMEISRRAMRTVKRLNAGAVFDAMRGSDKNMKEESVPSEESLETKLKTGNYIYFANGQSMNSKSDLADFMKDNPEHNLEDGELYLVGNEAISLRNESKFRQRVRFMNPIDGKNNFLNDMLKLLPGNSKMRPIIDNIQNSVHEASFNMRESVGKKIDKYNNDLIEIFKGKKPGRLFRNSKLISIFNYLGDRAPIEVLDTLKKSRSLTNDEVVNLYNLIHSSEVKTDSEGNPVLDENGITVTENYNKLLNSGLTPSKIEEVVSYIEKTPKLEAYANYLINNFYQSLKEDYEPIYKAITDGLPFPEGTYYPRYAQGKTGDVIDTSEMIDESGKFNYKTAVASNLKQRTDPTGKINLFKGADAVARNYVKVMERSKWFIPVGEKINSLFSKGNSALLINKMGRGSFVDLKDFATLIVTGQDPRNSESKTSRKVISQLMDFKIMGTLAFKLVSIPKQLTSFTHFNNVDGLDPIRWVMGMAPVTANEWDVVGRVITSRYVRDRVKGTNYDIELSRVLDSDGKSKIDRIKKIFMGTAMSPIIAGDIGGVLMGGIPMTVAYYRKMKAQGLSHEQAWDEAYKKFAQESNTAQQSSEASETSHMQRDDIGRIFSNYKTSQTQTTNKLKESIRKLASGTLTPKEYVNESWNTLYWLNANTAFTMFAGGYIYELMKGIDDEEERNKLLFDLGMESVQSVVDGLGYTGVIGNSIINKLSGNDWKNNVPLIQYVLEDIPDGVISVFKMSGGVPWEDLTDSEKNKLLAAVGGKSIRKQILNIEKAKTGEDNKTLLEAIMNWASEVEKKKYKDDKNLIWDAITGKGVSGKSNSMKRTF